MAGSGGESGTAMLATGADVGAACGWGAVDGVRTGDGCCGAEGATGTCCCPELAGEGKGEADVSRSSLVLCERECMGVGM